MSVLRVLLLALLVAGCARPERTTSHADWLKEATRRWPGETKARVIAAAEAVVKHSDPADITVEYNRSGFTARRKFLVYAVIAAANGEDRWNFSSSENKAGASAVVRIIQRGTIHGGQTSQRFRDNQTMVGSLRLFYARIDFMLGKRLDWIACSEAVSKLNLPQDAPGLQSLCSLTHQGADAAPPTPLAPKPTALPSQPGQGGDKALPDPPSLPEVEEAE